MNGMRFLFACALLIASASSLAADAFCDSGVPHPIDLQLKHDLERSGGVTSDMRDAFGKAYGAWDAELNRLYRALMEALSADERQALRHAQRAWLAFRDAEAAFWNTEYVAGGGTLALVVADGKHVDFVRDRVCQLQRYKAPTP